MALSLLLQALGTPCSCASGSCATAGVVPYGGCWEFNRSDVNQNCSAICGAWAAGTPWHDSATRFPEAEVDVQDTDSWSCKLPGALELNTGGGTHMTMAYFNAAPAAADLDCAHVIAGAARLTTPLRRTV